MANDENDIIDGEFEEIKSPSTNLPVLARSIPMIGASQEEPSAAHAPQAEQEEKPRRRKYDWKNSCLEAEDGSCSFLLANGHRLIEKMMQDDRTKPAYEFVGMTASLFTPFTREDAEAIIARAQDKGWQSIKLHGSGSQKALLYKAAVEAGLPVTNAVSTAKKKAALTPA